MHEADDAYSIWSTWSCYWLDQFLTLALDAWILSKFSTLYWICLLLVFLVLVATQNTGTHTVNLSIAQDFNGKEYIHYSIEEFCKGFLNDKFKGYTFIAHNSKEYNCHFVLKWLIDQGIKPYCIYNGAKIMFMEISKLSIRFIVSLNFLQMPLIHKIYCQFELPTDAS